MLTLNEAAVCGKVVLAGQGSDRHGHPRRRLAVMAVADMEHVVTEITPGGDYAEEIDQAKQDIRELDPEADDLRYSPRNAPRGAKAIALTAEQAGKDRKEAGR